jgi:ADP-heptose:LPS heptosyltransferase
MQEISKGADRSGILNYFKKVAVDSNQKENQTDFENMLDKDDEGRRIGIVLPEGEKDVFYLTSILPSIKELYPDYNIYFITSPNCFDVLDGNPYIHKTIPYADSLDDPFALEGRGSHKGYFDIAYFPNTATQRFVSYTHNCKDKTDFKLQCI